MQLMTFDPKDVSLADLNNHDGRSFAASGKRRFMCPFSLDCLGKSVKNEHRSLTVDTQTGQFYCHRCTAGKGSLLNEFKTHNPKREWLPPDEYRAMKKTEKAAAAQHARERKQREAEETLDAIGKARKMYEEALSLDVSEAKPGVDYLRSRGLGPLFSLLSGVRFHPTWYGRGPALVFPMRRNEAIVAADARYIDPAMTLKCQAVGPKRLGVFATVEAFRQPWAVIVESPIDALSLAEAAVPAIAVCGVQRNTIGQLEWLSSMFAGKPVWLGFDADDAGEETAHAIAPAFAAYGSRVLQLRPPKQAGIKDWNDLICAADHRVLMEVVYHAIEPDRLPLLSHQAGMNPQ